MLRVGSTFSGVGGADLGLERAGFQLAWTCEWDDWKRSVLAAHWPDIPHYTDVRDLADLVSRHDVRLAEGDNGSGSRAHGHDESAPRGNGHAGQDARPCPVDLLVGGFPCQDLSVAGKRRGFDGERSVLAFEFLRIAESIRPRWLLMENVPGLLSSNGGRDLARLLDELGTIGYGWAYRILDARYFGVPQRRRRIFIVAHRADAELDTRAAAGRALRAVWEGSSGDPTPGWPPRQDTPADAGIRAQSGGREPDVSPTVTAKWRKGTGGPAEDECQNLVSFYPRGGSMTGFARQDGVSPTLMVGSTVGGSDGMGVCFRKSKLAQSDQDDETWVESDATNTLNRFDTGDTRATQIINDTTVRRLTPTECERLMGWPDNWTAPPGVKPPDSKRYAACGDGIVSWVAYWIGCRIRMIEDEQRAAA